MAEEKKVINEIINIEEYNLANSYENITNTIRSKLNYIFNHFLTIGANLLIAKTYEVYKCAEYKDIYEYSEEEFGFKTTSTKNLIRIIEKFTDFDVKEYQDDIKEVYSVPNLKEEYEKFSYSQLVELLSLEPEEIEQYNPDMSVRQIRENKMKLKVKNIQQEVENNFKNEIITLIEQGLGCAFISEEQRTYEIKVLSFQLYNLTKINDHMLLVRYWTTLNSDGGFNTYVSYSDSKYWGSSLSDIINPDVYNLISEIKADIKKWIERRVQSLKDKEAADEKNIPSLDNMGYMYLQNCKYLKGFITEANGWKAIDIYTVFNEQMNISIKVDSYYRITVNINGNEKTLDISDLFYFFFMVLVDKISAEAVWTSMLFDYGQTSDEEEPEEKDYDEEGEAEEEEGDE